MTQLFQEKELRFEFPDTLPVEELDKQGIRLPEGMSFVDFVIEEKTRILLIEVKDPSHSHAPEKERTKYIKRLQNDSLINQELTPKARDSYTFVHLMERDSKPFIFIVLLGLDAFPEEKAILLGFKDRLLQRIFHEAELPWKRKYIHDCMVVSVKQWNENFPNWQVSRITEVGGA